MNDKLGIESVKKILQQYKDVYKNNDNKSHLFDSIYQLLENNLELIGNKYDIISQFIQEYSNKKINSRRYEIFNTESNFRNCK